MLKSGHVIAHFKIVRKLGEGGMGEVYLAEDQKLSRRVALKMLPAELFGDPDREKRFQREAQTAAQISHPHVMSIFEIGTADHPVTGQRLDFIVMEYVQGRPLLEYVQARPDDMATVVRLAEKIASGLAAAHKMSIVHRDIKAANVVVSEDGEPKILDFGLAKPLDPLQWEGDEDSTETISQQLTKAGKIVGTVSYMSPEQARGEPVDLRSDVFSFGILMYRMATGRFPFEGSTPVSTLAKILEARPQPARIENENVPPELERIIDKCLKKDPHDRYQDTRDLVVDLRDLRRQYNSGSSDLMTAEVAAAARRSSGPRVWRIRGKLVLAVVALTALAALLAAIFDQPAPDEVSLVRAGENSLAILTFENTSGDNDLNWLETGLPEILLTNLAEADVINIISPNHLLDYLRRQGREDQASYSRPRLVAAAKALGAAAMLSGSLYKVGERIRIDARLEETATGNIMMATKVMGNDAFELTDSLTARIAEGLDVHELVAKGSGVSRVTTSSPEAYRLYHAGMEKFGLELYDDAIELFEAALGIDPGFALAYMRIGMAHVFDSRPQEGAQYFMLAREHRSRLPLRERSLLEVYSGFWLDQQFDAAIVRLESYVENYPDDKEARAIHALVLYQIANDTVEAFAHLDAALQLDPQYQLALSFYTMFYSQLDRFEKALEYAQRSREFHPDSPAPYLEVARLYRLMGRINEAVAECQRVADLFPDNFTSLARLVDLYIIKRDFEASERVLEQYRERIHENPYRLYPYYRDRANLATWKGHFQTAFGFLHQAKEQAHRCGDSAYIYNSYSHLSIFFDRYHQKDSAIYYAELSDRWATGFTKLSYALLVTAADLSRCDEMREHLLSATRWFRERTPPEWWPIAASLENLFDQTCKADTAGMIDATRQLILAQPLADQASNEMDIGLLLLMSGRYSEGIEQLEPYLTGPEQSVSGFRVPTMHYWFGRAYEGMGDQERAIRHYKAMLGYWSKPETEIEEIKDARERLARLTS